VAAGRLFPGGGKNLARQKGLCAEWVDLPGMRMNQRAPVVTTHGPLDAPAFMQPVLPVLEVSALPITDLDHTTTGAAHHHKPTDEQAFYALLASTWRQHIGRGKPGGARQRVLTVLLGDGVTLASEVMTLAAAYDAEMSTHPAAGATLADHLLWTRPWAQEERHDVLPWPYLDCRPVRLTMIDSGAGAVTVDDANIRGRVDAGTGNIGDPHVPIRTDGKAMRLGGRMTYRQAHAALCGSPDITRAGRSSSTIPPGTVAPYMVAQPMSATVANSGHFSTEWGADQEILSYTQNRRKIPRLSRMARKISN
jgi:hypothetical protein